MAHDTRCTLAFLAVTLFSAEGAAQNYGNPNSRYRASYEFDELANAPAAKDESGNGNDLNNIRNMNLGVAGHSGNGVQFLGAQSSLATAPFSSLETAEGLTVEMWLNPTANNNGAVWVADFGQQGSLWNVSLIRDPAGNNYTHQFTVVVVPGNQTCQAQVPGYAIPPNAWTHVAAEYDGVSIKLFQNGLLSYVSSCAKGPLWLANCAGGRCNLVLGQGYAGVLDEFRLSWGRTGPRAPCPSGMISSGISGFCIDPPPQNGYPVEVHYGDALNTCGARGCQVCTLSQLTILASVLPQNYRAGDLMYTSAAHQHLLAGRRAVNPIPPNAVASTAAGPQYGDPAPDTTPLPIICCRPLNQ
jgi:Concanavalin A-like lectin/glucanases superfamily